METWKPVVGYEGKYEVSDGGAVRSVSRWVPHARAQSGKAWRNGAMLFPRPLSDGRLFINLYNGTSVRTLGVAVLVAEAFVGPKPPGLMCCHKDGDQMNDRWGNLYWGTQKQNAADRERHGRNHKGEKKVLAKLTNGAVRTIRKIKHHGSGAEHAKLFGVSNATISAARRGKTWKHLS